MSRKNLEVKKRHHYVWANYLARWGSGTQNVFYTTKNGKFAHGSVRSIVVDDYFYKTTTLTSKHVEVIRTLSSISPLHLHQTHMSYLNDFLAMQQAETIYAGSGIRNQEVEMYLHAMKCNSLENLHASHEKMALSILAALADEKFDVLQDKQHMIEFMAFFGHQISRTKTFRDRVFAPLLRSNALEVEMADVMQHSWWFLSYMFGMNIGSDLYITRHNSTHALLINDTEMPFITSDQPVVNVHSCVSKTQYVAPEHSDLYYPISPRVAYIICDSERFIPGKNKIDKTTVAELNSKLAAQAMVNIIGNTEDAIRPFKEHIGRSYHRASD